MLPTLRYKGVSCRERNDQKEFHSSFQAVFPAVPEAAQRPDHIISMAYIDIYLAFILVWTKIQF